MTLRASLESAAVVSARVRTNGRLTPEVYRCTVSMPPGWPAPRPGQFVQLECLPDREFALRRPFSVSRVRQQGGAIEIELVYAVVGEGTARLAALEPGATVDVLGPLGNAFEAVPGRRPILVGGGRGIAPMVSLADHLGALLPSGVILYGTRNADTQVPLEEVAYPVQIATEDGSVGFRGTVLQRLDRMHTSGEIDAAGCALYSCGPNGMLHALSDWAKLRGYPVQVSLETLFGCGFGICAGCAIAVNQDAEDAAGEFGRYRFACVDGPVFDGAVVDWPEVRE